VVEGRLPEVGRFGDLASSGDAVTAVGYPLGGPLTLSAGTVIDRVDGASLGIEGPVMRLTATVRPGNSGGPVLDRKGHVVGIVYAIERATGFGLAVPVDTLRSLVRAGGFDDLPACGYE
jgi:S1-C subfamily serine protease